MSISLTIPILLFESLITSESRRKEFYSNKGNNFFKLKRWAFLISILLIASISTAFTATTSLRSYFCLILKKKFVLFISEKQRRPIPSGSMVAGTLFVRRMWLSYLPDHPIDPYRINNHKFFGIVLPKFLENKNFLSFFCIIREFFFVFFIFYCYEWKIVKII